MPFVGLHIVQGWCLLASCQYTECSLDITQLLLFGGKCFMGSRALKPKVSAVG